MRERGGSAKDAGIKKPKTPFNRMQFRTEIERGVVFML
jgi:hypothetical protein